MGKISGKKFVAMYIAVCLLAASVCMPFMRPKKVEAVAISTVASIAGYVMTAMGAVNILTNGGVSRVAGSVYDAVKTKISDALGVGVYEDSNGNYIFTNEVTSELYSLIDGTYTENARVVSDFPANDTLLSSYTTSSYANEISSKKASVSKYIELSYSFNSGTKFYNVTEIYDLYYSSFYDFLYLAYAPAYNGVCFYFINRSSGSISSVSVLCTNITQYFDSSTGNFSSVSVSSAYVRTLGNPNYLSFDDRIVSSFPYFSNGSIYSNRSLVIGKDVLSANNIVNKKTGTIFNNVYTEIPAVSKNVIENNDWDSIYNSYVTNVDNQKNNYFTSENGTDIDALRAVMKSYGDNIWQAIEEGVSDISDRVNYMNDWLSRIYDRIGIIYDYISSSGSGGGSSSGSSIDYTSLITAIKTDTGNIDTRLINIYAYLDTIVSAINRVNTGISIDGSPNITIDHIFDDIMSISVDGITGYISKGQVFTSVAKNVSPLVFFEGMGDILEGLSSAPPSGYAPSWTIPFRVRNVSVGLDIDEEIEIDLSGFSSVHDILIALECLLFILFLMFFTIQMLRDILYIFS